MERRKKQLVLFVSEEIGENDERPIRKSDIRTRDLTKQDYDFDVNALINTFFCQDLNF
jgi:hypothetical protein